MPFRNIEKIEAAGGGVVVSPAAPTSPRCSLLFLAQSVEMYLRYDIVELMGGPDELQRLQRKLREREPPLVLDDRLRRAGLEQSAKALLRDALASNQVDQVLGVLEQSIPIWNGSFVSLCKHGGGQWRADIEYDGVVHEGQGITAAHALLDAALDILIGIKSSSPAI